MYRLTNSFYGQARPLVLNTSSSDLELQVGPLNLGLIWTFTPTPDHKYNICTSVDDTPYCLDILGTVGDCPQDCIVAHLATPSDNLGQQWNSDRTTIPGYDTPYQKLSNEYTGDNWYLDTYSGYPGAAFMSHGDFSGQLWSLDFVSQGQDSSSPQSSLSSTSAPAQATPTPSTTSSDAPVATQSSLMFSPGPTSGPDAEPASSQGGAAAVITRISFGTGLVLAVVALSLAV